MTPGPGVAGVVLAAGRGTRFGSTKQLALVDGRPLLRTAIESLLHAPLIEIVVVLGHDADAVRVALEGLPVRAIVNERFDEGMGASIGVGVAALDARVDAVLVALGDQPIQRGVVERLIDRWQRGGPAAVAPVYDGTRGNPVLFDAALSGELLRIEGARGGRDLLDRLGARVALVDFDFAAPADVDRPEDVALLEVRESDRPRVL